MDIPLDLTGTQQAKAIVLEVQLYPTVPSQLSCPSTRSPFIYLAHARMHADTCLCTSSPAAVCSRQAT